MWDYATKYAEQALVSNDFGVLSQVEYSFIFIFIFILILILKLILIFIIALERETRGRGNYHTTEQGSDSTYKSFAKLLAN